MKKFAEFAEFNEAEYTQDDKGDYSELIKGDDTDVKDVAFFDVMFGLAHAVKKEIITEKALNKILDAIKNNRITVVELTDLLTRSLSDKDKGVMLLDLILKGAAGEALFNEEAEFTPAEGDYTELLTKRDKHFAMAMMELTSDLTVFSLLVDEGYIGDNGESKAEYADMNDLIDKEIGNKDFFKSNEDVERWIVGILAEMKKVVNKYNK